MDEPSLWVCCLLLGPAVLLTGEIQLCPADVPLEWVSVLKEVTPSILSQEKQRAREVVALEQDASAALKGARLSKGLSCSKSRCGEFVFSSEFCKDFFNKMTRKGAPRECFGGIAQWSSIRVGSGMNSRIGYSF